MHYQYLVIFLPIIIQQVSINAEHIILTTIFNAMF